MAYLLVTPHWKGLPGTSQIDAGRPLLWAHGHSHCGGSDGQATTSSRLSMQHAVFWSCQILGNFTRLPNCHFTNWKNILGAFPVLTNHHAYDQPSIILHSSTEQRHCKFPGKPGSHSLPSSFDPFPDSAKKSSLAFFRSVLDPQSGWHPVNFSRSKLRIWAHYGSVHFQKIPTSTIGLTLRPTPAPSWPPAVAAANNSLHLALCKCFLRSKASVPSSGGWKLLNCWFPQRCNRDWYHLGSLKKHHNQ